MLRKCDVEVLGEEVLLKRFFKLERDGPDLTAGRQSGPVTRAA